MSGYKGGKYNILVTVYSAENAEDIKAYMKDKRNKVMTGEEIKKERLISKRSRQQHACTFERFAFLRRGNTSSNNIVSQKSDLSTDS